MSRSPSFVIAVIVGILALVLSGIAPKDRITWLLEAGPVLVLLPVLWYRNRKFPLTPLLYILLAVHAVILCVGAKYTYAEAPPGEWMRTLLHTSRNDYDKIGHFTQGFVPAILLREIFLRRGVLKNDGWLMPVILGCCLGFSALYELFEWITALVIGQSSDAFLGTQGDPWDTQSDMAFAGVGAAVALFFLRRLHDRQLANLPEMRKSASV